MELKAMIAYLKSLKFRIFLLIILFGIAPTFLLRTGILSVYEKRAVNTRTVDITSQAKLLASQIVANNYLQDTSSKNITTQLDQLSTIYDGRVMLIDSSFTIVKDTYALDEQKTILAEEVMQAYNGETVQKYDADNHYIEMTFPMHDESGKNVIGVMLVSVSTDSIAATLAILKQYALMIQFLVAVIVVIAGFAVSTALVRPFRRLTKSIKDVQDGYEADFISVNSYSETETMSAACDEMLRRLQTLDESRQEFVSNVSHELKTPLTSMKVLADSLMGQEDIPVELYREFMTDIGAEIDRENKIINDLLSLVKMDKSAGNINITSVQINELLERIMKRLRPIAQKQNVELVMESFRPVVAEVDEVKLTLALTNLIENAIKYNNPDGWVHVSLNADHQNFFVTVEDNGIGIPKEAQNRIFERFYRVDKSHSREIGGTGLGLAIARNAIIMHRGAIKVHSMEGEGTTFTVRIPLTYIS
ncbi:HAMP domain-containing sensor histidine kinase [Eubacterium ramulus]|jgi:signal transduction histidine kinase|uniref:histidine kinase n=1 Tax=Eubacterium ramulus TaxID=39490 RepID=A0A173VFA7_EUBRA|nr:HAMP domain-containing sensor histidine kinase [Eubacterium ramulus]MBS5172294.1 ATP-binding protein [Lachnospiraceae bacterium]MDR3838082.1 HAMP domain-containing sensor histidine kinase [Eubacterium sp.]MSC76582.1 HAMP domain-containing protein [Eubacterium ramulus]MSC92633.1 HAMP domain-containing protein [Eubacterium ramulus]RYS99589.1 sensor histidine kinase [Eubacterium ramulus]